MQLGYSVDLGQAITPEMVAIIATKAQSLDLKGATFIPEGGIITIYNTEILNLSEEEFIGKVDSLSILLRNDYPHLNIDLEPYIISLIKL